MIELYGSPTPSAFTIAIMLEEIGFNYSVFPVNKNSEQLDLELLKVTPNNIFPVILDRDGPNKKPLVIFEAGAILMYLAEKSRQFIPNTNSTERFDVLQWLLFENSKIGPVLGNTKHFMYHAPEEVPYAVKRFNNEAKRIFSIIDNQLAENDFLAGEYSIADIATFPWVREYERYGMSADQIPNMCKWLDRIMERKAVNKGMEALADLKE